MTENIAAIPTAQIVDPVDAANAAAASPADSVASFRARSERLEADLEARATTAAVHSREIEAGRGDVERLRAEIEGHANGAKHASELLQQQVDAARATLADFNASTASTLSLGKQVLETNAQAAAALESIRAASNSTTESVGRIEAIRTQVEQVAAVTAARSEHIEGGRRHADDVRARIDVLFTQAQQAATNAEAAYSTSRSTVEKLDAISTSAQATKGSIDGNAEAVAQLRKQCEDHVAAAKGLASIAEATETRIVQYEAQLADIAKASADRLRTIEGLLPGATSAGLASAFGKRREHYKWPQRVWQGAFVASLVALFALGTWEFGIITSADTVLSFEKLGLSLLHRLPLAIPLIWLAIYAARQAGNAKRVEEDYAFKEAVSRSFEGYRREMAQIEGSVSSDSALGRLCSHTLGVITTEPGRVYDRHRTDVSPATALADSAKPIMEAAAGLVAGKKGG